MDSQHWLLSSSVLIPAIYKMFLEKTQKVSELTGNWQIGRKQSCRGTEEKQPSFRPGWGALTLESGTGMCHCHDPLFQASRHSLAYQFTINAPLMCPPPFSILEKFCIFSLVLTKISALKTQIFPIFVHKTPHFSREICSLDPTFGNLCSTHPPNKIGGDIGNLLVVFPVIQSLVFTLFSIVACSRLYH